MKLNSLIRLIPSNALIIVKKIGEAKNIYCGFSSDLRFTKDSKLKSVMKNNIVSVTADKNMVVIRLVGMLIL